MSFDRLAFAAGHAFRAGQCFAGTLAFGVGVAVEEFERARIPRPVRVQRAMQDRRGGRDFRGGFGHRRFRRESGRERLGRPDDRFAFQFGLLVLGDHAVEVGRVRGQDRPRRRAHGLGTEHARQFTRREDRRRRRAELGFFKGVFERDGGLLVLRVDRASNVASVAVTAEMDSPSTAGGAAGVVNDTGLPSASSPAAFRASRQKV